MLYLEKIARTVVIALFGKCGSAFDMCQCVKEYNIYNIQENVILVYIIVKLIYMGTISDTYFIFHVLKLYVYIVIL